MRKIGNVYNDSLLPADCREALKPEQTNGLNFWRKNHLHITADGLDNNGGYFFGCRLNNLCTDMISLYLADSVSRANPADIEFCQLSFLQVEFFIDSDPLFS